MEFTFNFKSFQGVGVGVIWDKNSEHQYDTLKKMMRYKYEERREKIDNNRYQHRTTGESRYFHIKSSEKVNILAL